MRRSAANPRVRAILFAAIAAATASLAPSCSRDRPAPLYPMAEEPSVPAPTTAEEKERAQPPAEAAPAEEAVPPLDAGAP